MFKFSRVQLLLFLAALIALFVTRSTHAAPQFVGTDTTASLSFTSLLNTLQINLDEPTSVTCSGWDYVHKMPIGCTPHERLYVFIYNNKRYQLDQHTLRIALHDKLPPFETAR